MIFFGKPVPTFPDHALGAADHKERTGERQAGFAARQKLPVPAHPAQRAAPPSRLTFCFCARFAVAWGLRGLPRPCGRRVGPDAARLPRAMEASMGIFDAMTTAVTGLQAQSFALQNISGNIANSQTVGFKETNTSFQELVTAASTNA